MILEKKAGGEKLELDLSELDKTRDNFSFQIEQMKKKMDYLKGKKKK